MKIKDERQVPKNFTGIIEYCDGHVCHEYVGDIEWFKNGLHHREDGPAQVWLSGSKFWMLNGKRHRVDGPSDVYFDNVDAESEHYVDDIFCSTKEEYEKAVAEYFFRENISNR